MPRLYLFTLCALLLVACSHPQVRQLVPESELAQIDLETLVIQQGDVPAIEAAPENITDTLTYPGTVNSFLLFLEKEDTTTGMFLVAIYADINAAEKGYKEDMQRFQKFEAYSYTRVSPSVGEEAILVYRGNNETLLAFHRCHARVAISFPAPTDGTLARERIVEYAQRLDARLTPLVC